MALPRLVHNIIMLESAMKLLALNANTVNQAMLVGMVKNFSANLELFLSREGEVPIIFYIHYYPDKCTSLERNFNNFFTL